MKGYETRQNTMDRRDFLKLLVYGGAGLLLSSLPSCGGGGGGGGGAPATAAPAIYVPSNIRIRSAARYDFGPDNGKLVFDLFNYGTNPTENFFIDLSISGSAFEQMLVSPIKPNEYKLLKTAGTVNLPSGNNSTPLSLSVTNTQLYSGNISSSGKPTPIQILQRRDTVIGDGEAEFTMDNFKDAGLVRVRIDGNDIGVYPVQETVDNGKLYNILKITGLQIKKQKIEVAKLNLWGSGQYAPNTGTP